MSSPGRFRPRALLAALAGTVLTVGLIPALATPAAAATSAAISGEITAESTDFLVYLRDKADLSPAKSLPRTQRAEQVYTELKATAESSQKDVRALLDERKIAYKAFWIANAIWVHGDKALAEELAKLDGVASIEPNRAHALEKPTAGQLEATVDAVEWNIANIRANEVWSAYADRGAGIVVASIDSGVEYTHPALVDKYRGNLGGGTFDHNYNWFDPAGICPVGKPCDNNGHGTHTMGTMVGGEGANVIGVAPDAKWIAAKGCEINTCSDASLLAAGQWVLAPTDLNGGNPRPDLHPDVVNNSWGGDPGDPWYGPTVDAWIAAGIFPAFSNGNDGPACGSAGSPGDNPQVYSAGAYDISGNIASFSGRGASAIDGGVKPNISAPGVNVRSSVPGGYGSGSGTSMASPHVSGTVALMWSAAPALRGDVAATRTLLDQSGRDVDDTSCGGTAADNNVFGEGRLDAYQAVTLAPRGPSGIVTGIVRDDSTGTPIAAATVSSSGRSTTTAANGTYSLTLPAGDQSVTASKYGYHDETVTVTVPENGTATQDFALVSAPMVTVSGKVTDGSGHGWPLYARIDIPGRDPIFTNPFTGAYSVTLPGNTTHSLATSAKIPGYQTTTTAVTLGATGKTVNLSLPVARDCTAPGYKVNFSDPILSESFDTTSTPANWTVVNHQGTNPVWAFDDPGKRGNLTGGTGGFAIMDSDKAGSGKTEDTSLVTPVLDLSGTNLPYLRFNNDYRAFSNSFGDVDISTDGGTTWTTVLHQSTTAARGPRVEQLALAGLAGSATAQIRFHYKGTFAWWWEVDNVQLVDRGCTAADGGLVTGFVTDANTTTGLVGAKVASVDVPAETATSVATADDPAVGDGYYWLFSSAVGAHSFTATKSPYNALTKSVTVVADANKRADFALKSPRLTVTPTTIQAFQPYGTVRKTTVTVTNTGSATATVDLLERAGTFEILGKKGADLQTIKLTEKASTALRGVKSTTVPARASAPNAAWQSIADYPDEVFDNSAATLNGKVYSIGGGIDTGLENKAFVYDPNDNTWTALPNMPIGRTKPQVAAAGGKIYVLGGWSGDGAPVTTVDVFDPATGSWSTVSGATNPAARATAGVGVANGKIYLVGGCGDDSCTASDDVVVFDPATGTFSSGPAYPLDASWISCGGISGKIYCAGGSGDSDWSNGFALDPATGWSPIADAPLDLWGSAGSAAGGLFVLAGGVTAGSTAITNRTVAYDPATNTWSDGPNTQFTVYRGAGACGFYKIGGSPSSFVGSKTSETLPGLGDCDEAADVPWLSETPSTFTLAAGKSRTITVTLTATAAAGVAQPGKYTAQFGLRAETPYPIAPVSVEMNVSPPTSWGKVQGTVAGLSCSGTHVGVKAVIRLNLTTDPTVGYTLHADASGAYAWWLPKGTYQVIVAKDGWIPQAITVKVEAGIVRTADFLLESDPPCPSGV
ncbi:MAG: S8 family serine peptidase [Hamadaea sp.]|uniref:S8 family serine peptidase n=1 Tax=Hamadaea sp. TaxID=2024425 RepID=UPI0017F4D548|nr:S8 family serine peptidase [Hamadaea sp.]NUT22468.1 S8 family serine peptidase [Hamadaea sp.]